MAFLKRYGLLLAAPILATLTIWLAIRIVDSIDFRNNDFFTFWLAGHLVIQGGNPYDSVQWLAGHHEFGVTWIPNQAYVYPLPLSLLYAPLGFLPLKTAYITWVALSEWMMLAAFVLLLRNRAGRRFSWFIITLLIGFVFFRSTTLTLVNGQVSALLLLLLTGTVLLWEKGKWEWGSLLLPLLMLKPNLGAPVLVLLGIWLLFKRRYRSLLVIALGSLALLGIGLLQNPHWVSDYWAIGNIKVAQNLWGVPTLWGLGSLICGQEAACTFAFGGATSVLLIVAFIWWVVLRWKDISPFTLVALAIAVTLLVTPYIWPYDQLLLLIPVIDLTLALDQNGKHFIPASLFFFALDLLIVILLVFDTLLVIEIFNAILPLTLLGVYAALRVAGIRRALVTIPV